MGYIHLLEPVGLFTGDYMHLSISNNRKLINQESSWEDALAILNFGNNDTPSKKEISSRFRELSLKYHPDKNQNADISEDEKKDISERYKNITIARDYLMNPLNNTSRLAQELAKNSWGQYLKGSRFKYWLSFAVLSRLFFSMFSRVIASPMISAIFSLSLSALSLASLALSIIPRLLVLNSYNMDKQDMVSIDFNSNQYQAFQAGIASAESTQVYLQQFFRVNNWTSYYSYLLGESLKSAKLDEEIESIQTQYLSRKV